MRTPAGFFFVGLKMKYTKPPINIDEQIVLLKRRGMVFANEDAARHALANINYYRLRAYWLPFEDTAASKHIFVPSTSFELVLTHYAFDQRLKLLLMDAIERVEISMRTRWAHELALHYGSHAYLDVSLFANSQRHAKCLQTLQDEVNRSHETFIKHYLETYTEPTLPPIWVVCEVMTLGQLSQWLDNLKRRTDRQRIALPFGFDEVVICAFAHHLATVRNLCAHHSRVWNRKFTIRMKLPNLPAGIAKYFNPGQDRKIYNTLLMLALLLDKVCPDSTWKDQILHLITTMPAGTATAMGFPSGWEGMSIWADTSMEVQNDHN